MGKPSKLTVRAQRKYAHKAYIPGHPYKIEGDPREMDTSLPSQPVIMMTRRPVNDLLDEVAFKSMHLHDEDKRRLLNARVVLKRIEPLEQKAIEPVPSTKEPEESNSPKIPTPPISKSPIPNIRRITRKTHGAQRKSSTSVIVENLTHLNLRGRIVSRNWISQTTFKQKMKLTKAGVCARRISETSTEDDRPLTYFAKVKNKPQKQNRNKDSNNLTYKPLRKSLRKKVTKQDTVTVKSKAKMRDKRIKAPAKEKKWPEMRNNMIRTPRQFEPPMPVPLSIKESQPSFVGLERLPLVRLSDDYVKMLKMTEYPIEVEEHPYGIITDIRGDVRSAIGDETGGEIAGEIGCEIGGEIDTEIADAFYGEDETERQNEGQHNTLADFVIKIFNNGLPESSGPDVNEVHESLVRVQEWFLKNNEIRQPDDHNFKVPNMPRRREVRAPSFCSTTKTVPIPISLRESALRARCPAWNYSTLSDIVLHKHIIRSFCGLCTRCTVMFKSEHIETPVNTSHRPMSPDSMSTSDVIPSSSQYKEPNNIFTFISTETDHITKLKEIMTDKGKKIFNVAIIIKEKLKANMPLMPRDHTILVQVIAILNECNASRITESQLANEASITEKQSTQSRRRPLADDGMMSTSSKRMREENAAQEPPPDEPSYATGTRESRNFVATTSDFQQSPIIFANRMQQMYPGIGLCGIRPPREFKPICEEGNQENNFRMSNQYINRMLNRWGPETRQLTAIRYKQDENVQRSPLFQGLEVDLVKLYRTAQNENVVDSVQYNNEKWQAVRQGMKLHCPGRANSRLETLYFKYLLSYYSLTQEERDNAVAEVQDCWTRREVSAAARAQSPLWRQRCMEKGMPIVDNTNSMRLDQVCAEAEECVSPGRYTNFNNFKKLAQQVRATYFPEVLNPSPEEVEREFWEIVMNGNSHVCVHAATVDASEHVCGFTDKIDEPYGKHLWNLKQLRWSPENLLSYLGPSLGVSSPTIHYGMMFSTSCWHMDPTSVPWIEYLHSGPPKIWYSISANQEYKFRSAAEALCPSSVQNKRIWLPSDILMIPPILLRQYGVVVERYVQYPGEFVIVYPNTYCACIDTGLTISEGVYFAPHGWIMNIERIFLTLRKNSEPSLFSLEKLLIAMAISDSVPVSLLQRVHTVLTRLLRSELSYRQSLVNRNIELMTPQAYNNKVFLEQHARSTATSWQIQNSGECAFCRCHLHLSRVVGLTPGQTGLCTRHAVNLFDRAKSRNEQPQNVYCVLLISNEDIYKILNDLKQRMISFVRRKM